MGQRRGHQSNVFCSVISSAMGGATGFGGPRAAVLFLIVLGLSGGTAAKRQPKASALFAFGDSYADTGGRELTASSFKPPYGITWPGHPSGRYSNGHVQTDYLADILGLPSPVPFAYSSGRNIKSGINFALGGAGVTFAYGVPPLGSQIDFFELVISTGVYSQSVLASSVALVSLVGNDFSYPFSNTELHIKLVVDGIAESLARLYKLGVKNVLVATLSNLNCIGSATILSNYTTCSAAVLPLISLFNSFLKQAVVNLNKLPDANFIVLDEFAASTYLLNNSAHYGIKEPLAPCCRPLNASYNCGDNDTMGNPLYTVCSDPTEYINWDLFHPVESTWKILVDLFNTVPGFITGASTLEAWFKENSMRPPPSPAAPVPASGLGAVVELETALHALIFKPNYSEAIGLLQGLDLDGYLAGLPEQIVTVFLPNNNAFYSINRLSIDLIYENNQELDVMGFHTLKGYYGVPQLSSGVQNLVTISGLELLVTPSPTGFHVGPQSALIVDPALYDVGGQVVIHGIDKLLFPPGTGT